MNPDKRKAALTLLNDPEWRKWSDSVIARRCGVAQSFVGDLRRSLKSDLREQPPQTRKVTTGTVYHYLTFSNAHPAAVQRAQFQGGEKLPATKKSSRTELWRCLRA